MRVHEWQSGDVQDENNKTKGIIIEGKVKPVRHLNRKRSCVLDIRERSIQRGGLAGRAYRVKRDEGRVSRPRDPERHGATDSGDGEVEVARDLGEAPGEDHGDEGVVVAYFGDGVNDAPYKHET